MGGDNGFDGLLAVMSWVLNTDPNTSPYRNIKDIVLFVGAALALYFAFRRMKAADDQNRNQTKAIEAQTAQIELSRRDQLSKRFTEAVKQLGDDKLEIRMGGIAGLWAVATESTHPEDRIMVLDVLCAFVRNAEWPTAKEGQATKPDIALAMDRLGSVGPFFPWDGREKGNQPYRRDLTGGYFSGWTAKGEDWRETNFARCLIRQFEWSGIRLEGASFEGTVFESGVFSGLNENSVFFYNGALIDIGIVECSFDNFIVSKANLINVDFNKNKINYFSIYDSGVDHLVISMRSIFNVSVDNSLIYCVYFNVLRFDKSTFHDSALKDIQFVDCDMDGIIFKNCTLDHSRMYGCDLTNGYFHGTKITNYDWQFCVYKKEHPPEGLAEEIMTHLLPKEEPDDPKPTFLKSLGKLARRFPLFGAPFFWKKGAPHRPPGGPAA